MQPERQKKGVELNEQLAKQVEEDFNRRREERKSLEQQWQLNMNYLMGNQYAFVSPTGELSEEEKDYYWQNRAVYNHIAPIFETRLKFSLNTSIDLSSLMLVKSLLISRSIDGLISLL